MSVIHAATDAAKNAVDTAKKTVDLAIHDPEALREQLGEQVRDLPLQVLALTIRGVGQALVVGDRVRREVEQARENGVGAVLNRVLGEEPAAPAGDGSVQTEPTPTEPTPTEPAHGRPAHGGPAEHGQTVEGTARDRTVVPIKPRPDLPVPDYDDRSLPSLRARLRGLSAADVRLLLDYESTHAARPEVITMYERRITKLQAG